MGNWPSNIPRCCPRSLLTLKRGQNVTCPLLENEAGKVCPFSNYKEHNFDVIPKGDILVEKYDVAQRKFVMSKLEEKKLNHYCIGSNWQGEKENPMKMKVFTCDEPCGGRKPCIRTCDDAPTLANWNSSLREFFRSELEIESHLTKANSLERKCPESKVLSIHISDFLRFFAGDLTNLFNCSKFVKSLHSSYATFCRHYYGCIYYYGCQSIAIQRTS